MSSVMQDLKFAVRGLRRSPGFTVVTVLTLALGIGATAAIFSVVYSVLLRPLPFHDASRLVDLTEYTVGKVDTAGVPYPDYLVWSAENTVFDSTAAYFLISASNDMVVGGPTATVRARYSIVTNSFFPLLGVAPMLGHGFSAADETPGAGEAFLVSASLWRGLFGADPHALGRRYLVDGEARTLIGVMPPGFDFPSGCAIWLPTGTLGTRGLHDRISHPFHVLGRLRSGVTPALAQAQIESIQRRLGETYPVTDANWHVRVTPLFTTIVGNARTSLVVLLGAVGFILLIACTNVVNLMLGRASAREREFALRAALGAGTWRLVRQNLIEGLTLVVASTALGVVIAGWGLAGIIALTSIRLPRLATFHLDLVMLAFLALVAALVTVLIAFAPAREASRQNLHDRLRERGSGAGSGRRGDRLRGALVVVEVALAVLLLCGAGLMLESFVRLHRVDPGFRTDRLLVARVALPGGTYRTRAQAAAFVDGLLGRLRTIPGVNAAAVTTTLPLSGESNWGRFQIEGRTPGGWSDAPTAEVRWVSTDYFRALGVPLRSGRDFTTSDVHGGGAVIVNEAMAKRFWPGQDAIGRRLLARVDTAPRQIVGIAADVKNLDLRAAAEPVMYLAGVGAWYENVLLRTSQAPSAVASALREQVAAGDKGVALYGARTMARVVADATSPERFESLLLTLFGVLALGLAALGIYGVISFAVSRRVHEIGVRVALGAGRNDVIRAVVGNGMTTVLGGLAIGLIASLALTRFMRALLFQVSTTEPLAFGTVAAVLLLVALAAMYLPARRATKIDPVEALRSE